MLTSSIFVPVCHGHLIFLAGCVLLDWLFYTHCFVLAENDVMHDEQLEKIGLYRFD